MRASYLEDFYTFLRFPSVSTDDDYSEKVSECAHWLVGKLSRIGLEAKLVPTPGHPVVWAQNKHQPGRRTVLIYGHYDVQTPDPLELWESPPFEPVLKDGYVYARGSTDNKAYRFSPISLAFRRQSKSRTIFRLICISLSKARKKDRQRQPGKFSQPESRSD